MTREEALKLIPEGWEEARTVNMEPSIHIYYDGMACVYARQITPEPKTVTFKGRTSEAPQGYLGYDIPFPKGLEEPPPNTECEVTITWTPKPEVKPLKQI